MDHWISAIRKIIIETEFNRLSFPTQWNLMTKRSRATLILAAYCIIALDFSFYGLFNKYYSRRLEFQSSEAIADFYGFAIVNHTETYERRLNLLQHSYSQSINLHYCSNRFRKAWLRQTVPSFLIHFLVDKSTFLNYSQRTWNFPAFNPLAVMKDIQGIQHWVNLVFIREPNVKWVSSQYYMREVCFLYISRFFWAAT